ncbi:S26 family signal peptidase [Sphingobium fuliginis]|uniref:S26 family signal peptidase n=1 Tax=Sphingobium fuliginis ATCC 27551 TaxID=1208342 RepID=A0A5B8CF39_SPHSA|nr:S26 family signal peptidase [Sphingobium fuliginis]QDC37232.1 S26 family signal peptidase [Sphingobium fuliginis ATCC 27551]
MIDRRERFTLARWGDALRTDRVRRRRLRRRMLAIASLVAALGATVAAPPVPMLVWNVSASAPIGLYGVSRRGDADPGDMVLAHVPRPWRDLAARRRYIPINVPLVKRVAAAPGDSVCALGQEIFINGRWVTERRLADGQGRPMPWWSGCATLRNGALFLLMDNPDSFDSRYFGPAARDDIIGRALPLWIR